MREHMFLRPLILRFALLLSMLAVTGCATSPGETFRTFNLKDGDSVATGARERVITNHRPNIIERSGQITPQVVVCAEPSPDVATSIANSMSAGLSILGEGSGSLSGAQVENLLQLSERTVSIQLLRDQMYRACEAYSNGAINATNYTLIMSRLNETMITLMLGETAGGAFGRSLGTLGEKASGDASAKLSGMVGAINDIDQAASKLAAAENKVSDANAAYSAAKQQADDKKCGETDDACKSALKDLQTARDNAKGALDQAIGERDATKELLKVSVDTTARSSAESVSMVAGGGISAKPDEKVAKVLAKMQKEFVRRNPSQSLIEACLVELSNGRGNSGGGVADTMFQLGILGAQKAGVLNSENATAATIGARMAYRSGLYEYCVTNLPIFADKARDNHFALLTQENELESKDLSVRDLEARSKAAGAFADSLAKCNGIQNETVKADCLRTVGVLKDMSGAGAQKPVTPSASAPASASMSSPTQAYDIAKLAADGINAATANMPTVATSYGRGKDSQENKKLKAQLDEELKELGNKKKKLDSDFSTFKRENLRTLEGTHTDKRTAVITAKDDTARELALAEFRVDDLKLAQATDWLTVLANGFDSVRYQYEALKINIEKFNEDVK